MKASSGNPFFMRADAVCVPTCGGTAGLVAVSALGAYDQAVRLWPGLERVIGARIVENGHRVYLLTSHNTPIPSLRLPTRSLRRPWQIVPMPYHLVTFPTRRGRANSPISLSLVKESCKQLLEGSSRMRWSTVLLPRLVQHRDEAQPPWAEILRILANSLDDRVVLVEQVQQHADGELERPGS
jgi:hypothetical protein